MDKQHVIVDRGELTYITRIQHTNLSTRDSAPNCCLCCSKHQLEQAKI